MVLIAVTKLRNELINGSSSEYATQNSALLLYPGSKVGSTQKNLLPNSFQGRTQGNSIC